MRPLFYIIQWGFNDDSGGSGELESIWNDWELAKAAFLKKAKSDRIDISDLKQGNYDDGRPFISYSEGYGYWLTLSGVYGNSEYMNLSDEEIKGFITDEE